MTSRRRMVYLREHAHSSRTGARRPEPVLNILEAPPVGSPSPGQRVPYLRAQGSRRNLGDLVSGRRRCVCIEYGGPHREGEEPEPMMHGRGKLDSAIVAVKPTNKAERPWLRRLRSGSLEYRRDCRRPSACRSAQCGHCSSRLLQPLQECRQAALTLRIVPARIHQHADASQPFRLLRRRRKRPRCCAPEQSDERAPFHRPVPPVLRTKDSTALLRCEISIWPMSAMGHGSG
jgi:hypothetical protein